MSRLLLVSALLLSVASFSAVHAAADLPPPGEDASKEIGAARKLQQDADRLGEELTMKMLELEVEFHKKKEPVLKERNALLKDIPNFWSTIITRHPNHRAWIQGDDAEILKSLVDVEVTDLAREENRYYPLHTYRITMRFKPNEYFTNTVLHRDVRGSVENEGTSGINWMVGKAPALPSFFNFFESEIPDTRGKLQDHVRHEVAHVIRYEFWQNPFTYYDQPSYSDYQHLAEEHYAQFQERLLAEGTGEHEQHEKHHGEDL